VKYLALIATQRFSDAAVSAQDESEEEKYQRPEEVL
jgi:hypothetical protein